MSFLKRFLKNSYRDGQSATGQSSFENLSLEELEAHLSVSRYGQYELTDAIRPSYNLEIIPETGYRHDMYKDQESGISIPVLMASASRELLIDLFAGLLDPLGESVDVVLESSHERTDGMHQDLYREQIDLPVLKSTLFEYEELLLHDGCLGIAVLNSGIPLEVQFDEHKLIIMYGQDLSEFEYILNDHCIPCSPDLKFITEAEHVHASCDEYLDEFDMLKFKLGIDD